MKKVQLDPKLVEEILDLLDSVTGNLEVDARDLAAEIRRCQ